MDVCFIESGRCTAPAQADFTLQKWQPRRFNHILPIRRKTQLPLRIKTNSGSKLWTLLTFFSLLNLQDPQPLPSLITQ